MQFPDIVLQMYCCLTDVYIGSGLEKSTGHQNKDIGSQTANKYIIIMQYSCILFQLLWNLDRGS